MEENKYCKKHKNNYIDNEFERGCPHCLFSSGIIADGKGTKCPTCDGTGTVSKKVKKQFNSLNT